jgi:quercetin dioxygenase-like cupin family protein
MTTTHPDQLDLSNLVTVVSDLASDPSQWLPAVRFDQQRRYYTRLHADHRVDVWLLTWLTTQSTDLHDHGGSAAAFAVVRGELREVRADDRGHLSSHIRLPGEMIWVAPGVVHDVRNASDPAVSVHAYSPPLASMTFYRARRGRLTALRTVSSSSPEFEESR